MTIRMLLYQYYKNNAKYYHLYFPENDELLLNTDSHFHLSQNGSLSIQSIRNSDKGTYKCVATNGMEKSLEKSITILVHGKILFKIQN